jgi:hypothetical protein
MAADPASCPRWVAGTDVILRKHSFAARFASRLQLGASDIALRSACDLRLTMGAKSFSKGIAPLRHVHAGFTPCTSEVLLL